jgi:hypothetical protein
MTQLRNILTRALGFTVAVVPLASAQSPAVSPCGPNEVIVALRPSGQGPTDAVIQRATVSLPCDVILFTSSSLDAATLSTAATQVRLLGDSLVAAQVANAGPLRVRRPSGASARPIALLYRRVASSLPGLPESTIPGLGRVRAARLHLPGSVSRAP